MKEYNIDDLKPPKPLIMPINQQMVIKCRPVIANFKRVPLHKQFFKLMEWCRENGMVLPKGTAIAILRGKLDVNPITKQELDRFNVVVWSFRKWLGALAGMVVYVDKAKLTKTGPFMQIYRPLKNKREYMNLVGKHIERVDVGIQARHNDNLRILSMTQKQIDKMIQETSVKIDIEVGLPPDKKRRRRGSN